MTTIKGVFYTKEQYDALVAERDEWKREAELSKWPKEAAQEYHRMKVDLPAAEAERDKFKGVVVLIASKKCLNGNSSCDWPCVVCIARAALAKEDA